MRHTLPLLSLAALLIPLLPTTGSASEPPTPIPPPAIHLLANPRPLIIAHRGYSLIAPENTLAAFDHALLAGADLIELDYHHSQDGHPIVIHDATLDRTTNFQNRDSKSKVPVASRTASELANLEAGLWFHPPHPGIHLPSLETAIARIQTGSVTLIERKAGDALTLSRLLKHHHLVNQVVVQAFDWSFLADLRQLLPDQVLGALGPPGQRNGRRLSDSEKELNSEWLDEIQALNAQIVVWNSQVSREAIDDAHRRGLKVWTYTINDPLLAQRLLTSGVDGLITDNIAMAWKQMARPSASKP
jgi:glycerophosphoryl diester phosphodiesterase